MARFSPGSPLERRHGPVDFENVDRARIARSAMSVKGHTGANPLRFLEIYANLALPGASRVPSGASESGQLAQARRRYTQIRDDSWAVTEACLLPRIPGSSFSIGDDVAQPPYVWAECGSERLAVNFTYNSAAIHRILTQLRDAGTLTPADVEPTFDLVCLVIALAYNAQDHFVLRNINNNISMYLVPKAIEYLLGKSTYDADCQDATVTNASLASTLAMLPSYDSMDILDVMSLSLGQGIAFVEDRIHRQAMSHHDGLSIGDVIASYITRPPAIDHRHRLMDMIDRAGVRTNGFTLAAIVDDATETVIDLLWMTRLLRRFAFLHIDLIVNTARVSVNFSLDMLSSIWDSPSFASSLSAIGNRLRVVPIYCPLVSLQSNCLTTSVRAIIDRADAVFVKGAGYFETLQLPEKNVFYGFVVHGPISIKYTGLNEFDAVFAHVPAGQVGYVHDAAPEHVRRLIDLVGGSSNDPEGP
jgi:hypothetical protein